MNRNESLAHDLLEAGNTRFQMASHPSRLLFWVADAHGACEGVSANWSECTGQSLAEARGHGWLAAVHADDRARVEAALVHAVASRQGVYLHYRLCCPEGRERRILHDAAVRTLPSGAFNGLIGTLTDESDSADGEQSQRSAQRRVYEFLDGVRLAAVSVDAGGKLAYVNPVMADLIGLESGTVPDGDWLGGFVCPEDRARVARLFDPDAALSDQPHEIEYQIETLGGARLFRWHLTLIRDYDGALASITMMGSDITQWRRLGDEMRLTSQIYENLSEAMVITDRDNRIISVNQAFTALTGYSREEAIGQNPRLLQSGRHDPAFYKAMWASIVNDGHWRGDIWDRRKDGSFYPKFLAITALRDAAGQITHYSAIFYDVSDRKQLEEKLETLAHYDPLTGLPNRMLLQDRLEQAIAQAERLGQHFALLFIDLDGFKPVNDTYGHAFGDAVLKLAAQRIAAAIRGMDTAARLGGDEFVVILNDIRHAENAARVAEKILAALAEPYEIAGQAGRISASIGISLYPSDDLIAQELLRSADAAMYQAKREGKQRVSFHGSLGR